MAGGVRIKHTELVHTGIKEAGGIRFATRISVYYIERLVILLLLPLIGGTGRGLLGGRRPGGPLRVVLLAWLGASRLVMSPLSTVETLDGDLLSLLVLRLGRSGRTTSLVRKKGGDTRRRRGSLVVVRLVDDLLDYVCRLE